VKAKNPFNFYTSSQLVEITGKKAATLEELVSIIKEIDLSSIFYHFHSAFREHNYTAGAYSNDFSHWVLNELGETSLSEKLANINIKEFTDLDSLRRRIVEIIDEYIKQDDIKRVSRPLKEFYFCKSISVVQRTKYSAWDMEEFCSSLKKVGMRSLFFHFFEARLRLGKKTNDFSDWIMFNFNNETLAKKIENIDPYIYSMDELRDRIITILAGKKTTVFDKVFKWLKLK